ncbi:MAG: APC family permease [Candidatus Dormibacteraeota bacterium]|nr:APC family permease [Candidatus Dormibacteraeota bacterium]
MTTVSEPVVQGRAVPSQLKTNTLSLFDSTVIATSSVAPAYTLAATAAVLVAAVGLASPAAILVGFLPVLFIAIAYYYLNRMDPNCGASYSWVSRTLSPYVGWFTGWIQLAANVLFCAAAPILGGAYTLQLLNSIFPGQISSDVASNKYWIAAVGVLWLALVTFMVVRGIRITANFQWVLVFIEYLIVLGFAVAAIVKIATGNTQAATGFSGSWFNPGSLGDIGGVATGAALAVFFFWGWDTAANVNEETKNAERSPGQAGILSMFILLFIFLLAAVAIQMFLSQDALNSPDNQSDILYFFAQQVSGTPLAYLMVLAVLSSTVATTQTTLLPSSRLSFSMARDGVFPKIFGRIHPQWRTPWAGTIISSLLAVVVIVLTVVSDSVNTLFGNLILDIGVLVAIFYGVTGFASTWAFRKVLTSNPRLLIFAGILPLVGGIFLFAIAGYVVYQSWVTDITTALPVLVIMAAGIPLLLLAVVTNRNGFFRQRTVSYINVDGRLTGAPASTAP